MNEKDIELTKQIFDILNENKERLGIKTLIVTERTNCISLVKNDEEYFIIVNHEDAYT